MEEIDWSPLPEWVNFVTWDSDGLCFGWDVHPRAGEMSWLRVAGRFSYISDLNKPNPFTTWRESMVRRPAAGWGAAGLPPVGAVCEVLNNTLDRPEWESCKILYAGRHTCVYDSESCAERYAHYEDVQFRPIRTPEQIAAEEREKAIEDLRQILSNVACDDFHAAVAVIDAGYRKQAKP